MCRVVPVAAVYGAGVVGLAHTEEVEGPLLYHPITLLTHATTQVAADVSENFLRIF